MSAIYIHLLCSVLESENKDRMHVYISRGNLSCPRSGLVDKAISASYIFYDIKLNGTNMPSLASKVEAVCVLKGN